MLPTKPSIAVLRGAKLSGNYIGCADIDVWAVLAEMGYQVDVFLQGAGVKKKCMNSLVLWTVGYPNVPFLSHLLYNVICFFCILRINPDYIIVNNSTFSVGLFSKLLRKVRLILDIRTVPIEHKKVSLHKILLRVALFSRFTDGITAITQEMLNDTIRINNGKLRVPSAIWSSGYNPRFFNPFIKSIPFEKNDKKKIIIYHGSLHKERRLKNVLFAMKILKDEGLKDVSLWILGDGNDKNNLIKISHELEIDDVVRFITAVPYQQVGAYIAAADAGICPLSNEPFWSYQSPLKVIECLAMGRPVIATDIPAHKLIGGGIIFANRDAPEAIANAIRQFFYLSISNNRALEKEALETAEKFSWNNQAVIIDNFLRNISNEYQREP